MHCICSYNTYFSLIATPDMHVILRLEASLEYNATFCTFFFLAAQMPLLPPSLPIHDLKPLSAQRAEEHSKVLGPCFPY